MGLVDYMGDDSAIVQAARTSYGKGTKTVSDDRGLIRYLMRHWHTTPFEMVEFKFRVRCPMDCWRQWIRHRTASVNEYSTRYSEAIDSAQEADGWRLQSGANKQGSDGLVTEWAPGYRVEAVDGEFLVINEKAACYSFDVEPLPCEYLNRREAELQASAWAVYQERLKFGVAREQARKDLPLSTYTEAYLITTICSTSCACGWTATRRSKSARSRTRCTNW